ncbi:MAG: glycosyltransferase family 39 protein [Planctomycetaceae bacterium]|jgi:4-amino-4-deoxy-L-arabinose transferase-like glycosyltransferase|nr:glycosyltransferase family 39 protein [Planctomycetaceae bacterium]
MTSKQASLIFFFVAIIYFVLWTIIPFIFEPNFRYDATEMFLIGKEGVLATFKHPALNSIILELVYQRLNQSEIAPYLLNQIFFLLTAFAIWRVGREFLTPFESLFGVLTFYGYWLYFYSSLNYNHNVLTIFAWAFIIFFAMLAIKYDRYRDWIGLGIAIGVGFHCKITIVFIVLAILIFTILNSSTRKYWLRSGVYLAIIISLLIASPILYWIIISDFSFMAFPLKNRLDPTFANRIFVLLNAASMIPLLCLSFIVLFLPLAGVKFRLKEKSTLDDNQILARNFLLGVSFIAWFLMAFSCFVTAADRGFHDFMQIFIFTGLILIAFFKTAKTSSAVRLFFIFFMITMACYVVGYLTHVYVAYNFRNETRYLFPGKHLAAEVERTWRNRYNEPIKFVVGDWILAGNVAIYAKDRPTCHCDYNSFPLSTWSTDQDVLNAGGIAIWNIDKESEIPRWLKSRFPSAELVEPIELKPLSLKRKSPYRIGIAIIPPDDSIKPQPIQPAPIRLWTTRK